MIDKPSESPDVPIRVCQIVGKMNGGGVESFLMNHYRHIDRSRVQFDFVIDSDSLLIPEKEIERLGGRVFLVPPYKHVRKYCDSLSDIYAAGGYRIVHSHLNTLSPIPLYVAKKAGVPIRIAHSHATAGSGEPFRNLLKYSLRFFANIYPTDRLACSWHAGTWLFGRKASFDVIDNAIDLEAFQFQLASRERLRKNLNLPSDAFVVGHVGRFVQTKNQLFMLDCFAELCKQRDDAFIVFVGDGPLLPAVKKKAGLLGLLDRVIFAGHCVQAHDYYNCFDVFALPSLYEGFGMVLIEAQQNQLPVVCSDRISREVACSPNIQFVSLAESPRVWASALQSKASTRVDGINGLKCEFVERFDISNSAKRLETLYAKLYSKEMQDDVK